MTPEHMADLHARAFAGQGRGWSEAEFATLLDNPYVFAIGDQRGFALGRVIADEAELLTIAIAPDQRRAGLGRLVLTGYEAAAAARGATSSFLEVACDNAPARALYTAAGYCETGRRAGYYPRQGAGPADALILRKPIADVI